MLPIESVLNFLLDQFQQQQTLVIQAPPGAGKTTRIPIALLENTPLKGKILVIQPRRLAVYGAAWQLANNLNESVGKRIGYRTRYDRRISHNTEIEVITDGLFLQQIQNDPELNGIATVIFDEFHERSVAMDLGLAFALECQAALREADNPLHLMIMSATLNGDHLSQWLRAPLIASEGRSYPVSIYYTPLSANQRLEQKVVEVVCQALIDHEGDALVFLPGMKQIRRVEQLLKEQTLAHNVNVLPLHASLSAEQQERALLPDPSKQRKVVLSTNVAETSVTIEGIGIVIDSGQARVSRYDERRGMNHLQTEPISAASAEQRSGRAGRTQAGVCYRLWGETRHAGLKAFTDPEMVTSDLAPIVLEMARWGVNDPKQLTLLTQPNPEGFLRAQQFLYDLGALNEQFTITEFGRNICRLPLTPRLATLVWRNRDSKYSQQCCFLAALLSENDPLNIPHEQFQSDIELRLLLQDHNDHQAKASTLKRIRQIGKQLQKIISNSKSTENGNSRASLAQVLAQAFPDRIAQQRQDNGNRYRMSNGKGVQLAPHDNFSQQSFLVVLDCEGDKKEPVVRLACSISLMEVRAALANQIRQIEKLFWNADKQRVEAQHQEQLEELLLSQRILPTPWPMEQQEKAQQLLLNAITDDKLSPLPWNDNSRQLLQRLHWLHRQDSEQWPDMSLNALIDSACTWLQPYLAGCTSFSDLQNLNVMEALKSQLPWQLQTQLDTLAPSHWPLPSGRNQVIDYHEQQGPILRARVQEFYGLTQHPILPNGHRITVECLSPAQRPLQITQDLPGFWQGSYHEVAKEMRGRYPKHFWPDNPSQASATTKTKRHIQQ